MEILENFTILKWYNIAIKNGNITIQKCYNILKRNIYIKNIIVLYIKNSKR